MFVRNERMVSDMKIKEITLKYNLSKIEKVIEEFNLYDISCIPYKLIKVKIYQRTDGNMIGYTNLQYKDRLGYCYCGVGYGTNESVTIQDTIQNFLSMLETDCKKEDFIIADSFDF